MGCALHTCKIMMIRSLCLTVQIIYKTVHYIHLYMTVFNDTKLFIRLKKKIDFSNCTFILCFKSTKHILPKPKSTHPLTHHSSTSAFVHVRVCARTHTHNV